MEAGHLDLLFLFFSSPPISSILMPAERLKKPMSAGTLSAAADKIKILENRVIVI
jgi:hypothetical protein